MTSISKHLLPGEKVLYRARYHWLYNMRSGFVLNAFHIVLVTTSRVFEKRGVLATHAQSIPFSQVESIDVEQSVLGRLLGYGDVLIQGSGAAMLRLENIRDPLSLTRAIGGASLEGKDERSRREQRRKSRPGKL